MFHISGCYYIASVVIATGEQCVHRQHLERWFYPPCVLLLYSPLRLPRASCFQPSAIASLPTSVQGLTIHFPSDTLGAHYTASLLVLVSVSKYRLFNSSNFHVWLRFLRRRMLGNLALPLLKSRSCFRSRF